MSERTSHLPPRDDRPKLWGFVSVPVPQGPDRYRTAGFLLKALAWLVLVTGILVVAGIVLLSFVLAFIGFFTGSFASIFATFFGFHPETWPFFTGLTSLMVLLLLVAGVAVALTLGAIALVNLAYLRWAYREPGAIAWARGVSTAAILWHAFPLVTALSTGGTDELQAVLTGVPLGLLLLGASIWLLVLTFDPDVEAHLATDPPRSEASFEVLDR